MRLTKHAQKRMQQRGFRHEFVKYLYLYGEAKKNCGNAIEIILTNRQRQEMISHLKKEIQFITNCSDKAIIINEKENMVITAYNRN